MSVDGRRCVKGLRFVGNWVMRRAGEGVHDLPDAGDDLCHAKVERNAHAMGRLDAYLSGDLCAHLYFAMGEGTSRGEVHHFCARVERTALDKGDLAVLEWGIGAHKGFLAHVGDDVEAAVLVDVGQLTQRGQTVQLGIYALSRIRLMVLKDRPSGCIVRPRPRRPFSRGPSP